ncbi:MAG: CGNR zinc finger domain-containing protein [Sphingomonas bacterium]
MPDAPDPIRDPEERDGFRFRGGHRAIDLTATLQGRLREIPRELLNTPDDLVRWLAAAGLGCVPDATPNGVVTARALREAIFMLASQQDRDARAARATLNRIAAGVPAVPVLQDNARFSLAGDAEALLVTLAREAVQLLGGREASRIRQCQSPTCTIFFVDNSRKGDRRWCSMSACGNKAKVAEFRQRRNPGAAP